MSVKLEKAGLGCLNLFRTLVEFKSDGHAEIGRLLGDLGWICEFALLYIDGREDRLLVVAAGIISNIINYALSKEG